jgi:hypothetical protein
MFLNQSTTELTCQYRPARLFALQARLAGGALEAAGHRPDRAALLDDGPVLEEYENDFACGHHSDLASDRAGNHAVKGISGVDSRLFPVGHLGREGRMLSRCTYLRGFDGYLVISNVYESFDRDCLCFVDAKFLDLENH